MLSVNFIGDKEGKLIFELGKEIGSEGKNSKVYLAKDIFLDADLVVKVLNVTEQENLDKYLQESRLLYLSQHNNVSEIQHVTISDNKEEVYIAMPYYEKGSLSQLMKERNLKVRDIIKYAFEFISGISYIHSKGLIHGDIKPNNIFIANNGEAIIADFGLAQILDEFGWTAIDGVYIPHCPPEIVNLIKDNQAIVTDIQIDIWQIGMTLFRMCLGYDRYKKLISNNESVDSIEWIEEAHALIKTNIGNIPPHIPSQLVKIIKKCLHEDSTQRYQSVRAILNDLACIKDGRILDWNSEYKGEKYCFTLEEGNNFYQITEEESLKYSAQRSTPKRQYRPIMLSGKRELRNYLETLK